MREFFRGRKRKVGCITLVLACLFAVGWMRTLFFHDSLIARNREWRTEFFLVSSEGGITWQKWQQTSHEVALQTGRRGFEWKIKDKEEQRPVMFTKPTRTKEWCGFRYEEGDAFDGHVQIKSVTTPYWSIVAPLTALSAWLLLSKPRTRMEPSITPASEAE